MTTDSSLLAAHAAPPPDTAARPWVQRLEAWVLVVVVAVMAALPTLEALLRKVAGGGIPGSQQYVQLLTLWAGFLGAVLAAGSGRHLALATGELIPAGALRTGARIVAGSVSVAVCALLAYASWKLVQADAEFSTGMIGRIPEWWGETVMPAALALMALRFAWRASDTWWGRLLVFVLGLSALLLDKLEAHSSALLWPGVIVIAVGLLAGAPIFVGMAGVAMLLFFGEGTPIASVPTETYRLVASPTLPAIPLLTVAGTILAEGGASGRLVRLARAWFGWMPGGLALIVCFVLAAFTTFTGGSGVTILALGGLVLPMLREERYPEGFSQGLVMTSGSLGLLFPPSLPVILYAVVVGASIEELYLAGFLPGLLMMGLIAGYGVVTGVREKTPRHPFVPREALGALWDAKWELLVPLVVVLAILTGFATLVESAAIALVVATLAQCLVWKDLHPVRQLPAVVANAATLVGAVVLLLGVAMGLTSYLVDAEVPAALLSWTQAHVESKWVFLLALNALLLVLGSVLEIYAAIAVLAPLLAPLAALYGIDPLHLGIVFLANLELGFLFPPMGLNLILASSRFGQPLPTLYKRVVPFLLLLILGVLLITYVPAMTVGFVDLVRPRANVGAAP